LAIVLLDFAWSEALIFAPSIFEDCTSCKHHVGILSQIQPPYKEVAPHGCPYLEVVWTHLPYTMKLRITRVRNV
jgi:hypothetical protein